MDKYIDITILEDPEFPCFHLMNALFAKLHAYLARARETQVGISFPKVAQTSARLGNVLRLHGSEGSLSPIAECAWLAGVRDHVYCEEIRCVPERAQCRRVCRVQVKSNVDRIRRRLMKRHAITLAEASRRVPSSAARRLCLPYLTVASSSTGQKFNLFIDHRTAEGPVVGRFGAYGLSDTATVPWF